MSRGCSPGRPAGRCPWGCNACSTGRPLRAGLRLLGLLATAYVVVAAVFGRDDALNPTAGSVYVLLWIAVPLLSVLLGPVWRVLNPLHTLHRVASCALRTGSEAGLSRYPPRLGYHPAAASLLAFVWLELVAPDNTTLRVMRTFFAAYLAVHLLGAAYYGSRWFGRAGRLVLRDPLSGVAGTPVAPGLFAVVGVLLGSTAYDSFSASPWWVTRVQESSWDPRLLGTTALLGASLW